MSILRFLFFFNTIKQFNKNRKKKRKQLYSIPKDIEREKNYSKSEFLMMKIFKALTKFKNQESIFQKTSLSICEEKQTYNHIFFM